MNQISFSVFGNIVYFDTWRKYLRDKIKFNFDTWEKHHGEEVWYLGIDEDYDLIYYYATDELYIDHEKVTEITYNKNVLIVNVDNPDPCNDCYCFEVIQMNAKEFYDYKIKVEEV